MQHVTHISLARQSIAIEEPALNALEGYLARANKALKNDPDKDEIIQDIEQSLYERLSKGSKNLVVDKQQMNNALNAIGEISVPEDKGDASHSSKLADHGSTTEKIRETLAVPFAKDKNREVIDGIAAGIARRFGIDPIWVRLAFVLGLFVTDGAVILVYIVLAIIMPSDPLPSAQEIVQSNKTPLTGVQRIEKAFKNSLFAIFTIAKVTVGIVVSIALFAFLLFWSTVFFRYIQDPASVALFGPTINLSALLLIISIAIAAVVPFVLLFGSVLGRVFSRRFTTVVLVGWGIAVLAAVGATVNLAPRLEQYLIDEQPDNDWISVTVQDNEIIEFCLFECSDFVAAPVPELVIVDDLTSYQTYSQDQYLKFMESQKYELRTADIPASATREELLETVVEIQKVYKGPLNVIFDETIFERDFALFSVKDDTEIFEIVYFARPF